MMRKKIVFIFSSLLIVVLCVSFWAAEGSVPTLPLDQVKAGMKGKGRSVFVENKIEEFDVEILGVLRNFEPKRSLILARLSSGILENAGMIMGMSGSPVYIGGKLIGAVAYSFPYAKEAIAGITPIDEMLSISGKESARSSFSPRVPFKKHLSLEELFELHKEFFNSKPSFLSGGQTFTPLTIPLVFTGFSSRAFEKAKPFFSRLGFNPVRTGSSGQSAEEISPSDLSLQEGAPVAIQLVRGDLDLSGVGTVTRVDGNKILAFGHPMYNLGPVDYGMTKAKVITVVPSISSSFKIAATDVLVGRFSQDRPAGLAGKLGEEPRFIPLNIKMMNDEGDIRDFKIELVRDKFLTAFLANMSLSSILSAEERALGDLSIEFAGNIYLENGMNVRLEDLYSGNFDTSIMSLSNLFTAVVYFLINNEFEDLGIHRIDLTIRASEGVKFSYLERVWLDKYEASPGEAIKIKIYYRNFRGTSRLEELGIYAPHLPSGSEFHLIIADAASLQQIELGQYRRASFVPRNLNQLIRMLNNLRKNNRIYLKIIASKPGLFLKGEEMPNLPPTMKAMFSSPRAAASAPTELEKSTLSYTYLPVTSVFRGAVVIPIKIR
ncbi:MAG: hypothetical protein JSV96_01065 [Candidatus Aminicenantes bacterium]|nr:MAG: hypothetical protein JSV96_01065 [Candidatus Aminicenantes bacterium]